ncbi:LL-diaminopimelate aminotransferase [Phycisphaerae bacterium RAS1]|nr:LL-diaminopimelate aminotransferase [Phycisphaerae bacterium RAS1]
MLTHQSGDIDPEGMTCPAECLFAAQPVHRLLRMNIELPDRLKALPPYLFVEIDRKKRAALAAGKDVINFGVGDPDQPTHDFIIERLGQAMRHAPNHRYPADKGPLEFRENIVAFFRRRYGVELDVEREIHPLIGTKEGLGHLPLAVVNPGRKVLVPDPGYPVYRAATLFAGGVPKAIGLSQAGGWLPDFSAISRETVDGAVLMFVNYPNNPTGAVATRDFYEQAVAFARRHNLIVASDAAYNEMGFGAFRPPSILEIAGAKEVAIEFHSLSKTFNMTGWRLGFAVGNADVVAALAKVKANVDSGQFGAIQEAGATAIAGIERPEIEQARRMYHERARVLCGGLKELGFDVSVPKATFYVWAGVPKGYDSMGVAGKLLDESAVVCIPGTGFGEGGQGYVRFALTVDVARTQTAIERMRALKW